jgi:NADPH2:quinone reductase
VRFELVFMMPEEAKSLAVSDITRWLDEGRLHHNVAEVFPLEQAVAAHQAVEAGPLGKVILDVGPQA